MDIMPMNLQTEGKQNPVFAPFNQAIESGDASKIYKVIVPIIREYYFSYTKNPSSLEDVVAVIAERFFRVMKENPDMSPNYYWGVIKKGVLWELYSIWKHKNDIFLSELLDVEDHMYPESMMKSVSELYRESAKSLGNRRVRRGLEDAANSFMTAEDIMAAYNLSPYEVYSLLRKYQITIIPSQVKKKGDLFRQRKSDIDSLTEDECAGKWGISFPSLWIKTIQETAELFRAMGAWCYGLNEFPIRNLQDYEKFKTCFGYCFIPKGTAANAACLYYGWLRKREERELKWVAIKIRRLENRLTDMNSGTLGYAVTKSMIDCCRRKEKSMKDFCLRLP